MGAVWLILPSLSSDLSHLLGEEWSQVTLHPAWPWAAQGLLLGQVGSRSSVRAE